MLFYKLIGKHIKPNTLVKRADLLRKTDCVYNIDCLHVFLDRVYTTTQRPPVSIKNHYVSYIVLCLH